MKTKDGRASHLTPIRVGGAKLVAWHTGIDAAAYKMPDGTEALYLNGRFVEVEMPTQFVIALCHMTVAAAQKSITEILKTKGQL